MRVLLILAVLSLPALAQNYVATNLSAPISNNNVALTDLTHAPGYNINGVAQGQATVNSITTDGATVTYHLPGGIPQNFVQGDTISVTTTDQNMNTTPVPADLLTTGCVTTGHHSTVPYTISCASSAVDSWTYAQPYWDQSPTTQCGPGNKLWQFFVRGIDGSATDAVVMERKSTTACNVIPSLWAAPTQFYDPGKCSSGIQCGVWVTGLVSFANGNLTLWMMTTAAADVSNNNPYSIGYQTYVAGTQTWTAYAQYTTAPSGHPTYQYGCVNFQQATVNPDGSTWVPMIVGAGGYREGCGISTLYKLKTTDSGVTWTPDVLLTASAYNGEVACDDIDSMNSFCLLRTNGSQTPPFTTGAFALLTTTNGWTSSSLVASAIPFPTPLSYQSPGSLSSELQLSPNLAVGVPSATLDTLTFYNRYSTTTGWGAMGVLVINRASVISSGATYLATLVPTWIWYGFEGDGLDGYPFVYQPTPTSFNVWWHGQPTAAQSGLNIFQMSGTLLQIGSSFRGGLASSGGSAVAQ